MTMSITELLANTLSPVQAVRDEAVAKLDSYAQENFPQYLRSLYHELANEGGQSHIRKSAGLILKNAISSRDPQRQIELNNRWFMMDTTIRMELKEAVLQTLNSADASTGTVSAQVIAAVAAIELPRGEWQDLIAKLLERVTTGGSDVVKQSSLQAIGFICETIDPNVLQTQSNSILTAVASGARKEEPNVNVRLAAIQALYNSLEFVRDNFEVEGERNYIMQIVCEATQSDNADLQVAAFECLVKIMSLYYDKMVMYMQKALYGLTILGMRHENEKVALQAVEFWSTVCEIEYDIALDIQECQEANIPSERVNHQFALAAISEITPVLLYLMTKQEEDDDEDEWNISKASATCLSLLATCTADAIVPQVLPFVESNIKSEDWRCREAAVMAFGSILDGPDQNALAPLVKMALPTLIHLMNDAVLHVKDSTVWTLSRICELMVDFIEDDQLQAIIGVVVSGLQENPRVASNCAWCVINLAEQIAPKPEAPETSRLSPYFQTFIGALNAAGEKPAQDSNVRAAAYEAMATLVSHAAPDCQPTVEELTKHILERLNTTLSMANQLVGADDRRAHFELQANLCSVLTSIIRRLGASIAPIADQLMQLLLMVISNASRGSTVMEDAFLAVGAVTTAVEGDFVRYMDSFVPFLHGALQNFQEEQMCAIAIGLVGDICRALNDQVFPYTDAIMNLLGQLLSTPTSPATLRSPCLSCLGDIALAIGGKFEVYVHPAMTVILSISESLQHLPQNTYEQADFVYQMREGIAEAFVGITQGLKSGNQAAILLPYVPVIFVFMEQTAADEERPESVTRSLIGLIGDLAESLPPSQTKAFFSAPWFDTLLKQIKTDRNISVATKEVGKWAREMVRRQIQG